MGLCAGASVRLGPDQSRHALRVLRLKAGDAVQLLDGRGTVAQACIASEQAGQVVCGVVSVRSHAPVLPRLTVATAVPKGPRGDAMANDLAQLGADVWVPMRTRRSVVHPGEPKLDRYRKASAEAAKQCGRPWWMQVAPLTPFEQVLTAHAEAGLRLLADPAGEPTSAVAHGLAGVETAVVLIGPEGGFTDEEKQAARHAGFVSWRFAEHVLRVETAGAAAVAVLRALA